MSGKQLHRSPWTILLLLICLSTAGPAGAGEGSAVARLQLRDLETIVAEARRLALTPELEAFAPRLEQAKPELERLDRPVRPDTLAALYFYLGLTRMKAGAKSEAETAFADAAAVDPQLTDALAFERPVREAWSRAKSTARAGWGRLEMRELPAGAGVYVDGRRIDRPSDPAKLPPGHHLVQLEAADGTVQGTLVRLVAEQTAVLEAGALAAGRNGGELWLDYVPMGAQLHLEKEGAPARSLPAASMRMSFPLLEPAQYRLTVRLAGFRARSWPVAVESGRLSFVTVKLKPRASLKATVQSDLLWLAYGRGDHSLSLPISPGLVGRLPNGLGVHLEYMIPTAQAGDGRGLPDRPLFVGLSSLGRVRRATTSVGFLATPLLYDNASRGMFLAQLQLGWAPVEHVALEMRLRAGMATDVRRSFGEDLEAYEAQGFQPDRDAGFAGVFSLGLGVSAGY